jgi:hypothetical protein
LLNFVSTRHWQLVEDSKERFGVGVAALVLVEESKVVEARGDIRVVGAKRLLPDTQGVSEGFGSFLVITLLVELNTLLVECLSLFEGVRSRNGRIPNQYHGYGQKSQKACKAPKIAGKIL